MSEMEKTYNPTHIEKRIYKSWNDNGYFKAKVNPDKKPYSIVIPPPNVTGMLHIGHVLNNTLQDIYIRFHKLKGFETCWVPGTDHASIATESKVVKLLKEEGVTKEELGREKFLGRAMEWKDKYGGIILKQLKELGCSCDWDRERFTMDDDFYDLVIDTFVDLHKKGLIYKGYRLVNWCPVSKSVISDEEVQFKESNGKLWYFKYMVKDSDESVTIATTRPETMLGDTAVAVNPDDERFSHLVGKTLILPLVGREIPVIADDYVDKEFGTGCVKITPAHDINDYEMGKRHDLAQVNIFNKDATINDNAPEKYRGLERYKARKVVVADLEEAGLLVKIEDYKNKVGYSERGGVPIESLLSEQWYLKMEKITKPALDVVNNGEVKLHPEKWVKTYNHWLDNVQDWCISRQLWWGHRIPAYYCKNTGCESVIMVSKDKPAVCEKCGKSEFIVQEEDVLDTWASSWLWPYGVFKNQEEQDYFYPTNVLFTAHDIIYFWVARMVMAGLEYKGKIPFNDVCFHGMVKDEKGKKMSKSIGNSPDPLDIIAEYGADALRFTIIRITPAGNDVLFNEKMCDLGKNFANKIWNAARFIEMHITNLKEEDSSLTKITPKKHDDLIEDKWILSRFHNSLKLVEEKIHSFQTNEALIAVYEFLWNDFCDWYIEMSKTRLASNDKTVKVEVLENLLFVFEKGLKILHPFMPFITEELWQSLFNENDSIMLQQLEDFDETQVDNNIEKNISLIKDIIGKIRNVRGEYVISPSKSIDIIIKSEDEELKSFTAVLKHLAKLENIEFNNQSEKPSLSTSFIVNGIEIFISLEGIIDLEKEKKKLNAEIERLEKTNFGINKKLSNEKFVVNAPKQIIDKEREKIENNLANIEKLKENLSLYS